MSNHSLFGATLFSTAAVAAAGALLVRRRRKASSSGSPSQRKTPEGVSLRIIHFNDVYNAWASSRGDKCGGASRFVAAVDEYRAGGSKFDGREPLVLFSGDLFNPSIASTFTKGQHLVPVINRISPAVACYGNHDFDFGIDVLNNLRKKCTFTWLMSNVLDSKTRKPLAGGKVVQMLEHEGLKIGVMGLVEDAWIATLSCVETDDIVYEDFVQCAHRLSRQLREQGADLVVALTHMRVPNDQRLAQGAGDVLDLILGGHDHHYVVEQVPPHGITLCKSGTDFRDFTVLDVRRGPGAQDDSALAVTTERIEITRDLPEAADIVDCLSDVQKTIQKDMGKVIGSTAVDLDCRFSMIRTCETNVSNFVADAVRSQISPKPDIALINAGTLRTDAIVPAGVYRREDLLKMLPMLDPLVVLSLSGAQLLEALENGVSQYPALEGRFPCISGVRFAFDPSCAPGQRVDASSVTVGGTALQQDKQYTLLTKEYIASGKDGYTVFADCPVVRDSEELPMLGSAIRRLFLARAVVHGWAKTASSDVAHRACQRWMQHAGIKKDERDGISPVVDGRIHNLRPE